MCSKYILDQNVVSYLQYIFWSRGVLFVILTILLIIVASVYSLQFLNNNNKILDVMKFPKGQLTYIILLSSVTSFIAFIAIVVLIYAFKISNNIGYTVALVSTTSIFTLLLTRILFKKKINMYGLVGVFFIIFGVFMIGKFNK